MTEIRESPNGGHLQIGCHRSEVTSGHTTVQVPEAIYLIDWRDKGADNPGFAVTKDGHTLYGFSRVSS